MTTDISYKSAHRISKSSLGAKLDKSLSKRSSVPPSLALNIKTPPASISSSFSSTMSSMTSYRTSQVSSHQPRKQNAALICAFCEESMAANLQAEGAVELSCGDMCHRECLSIMFDRDYLDILPTCNNCGQRTGCAEDSAPSSLLHEVLLYDKPLPPPPMEAFLAPPQALSYSHGCTSLDPGVSPVTPLNQMIPDTLRDPLPETITVGTQKLAVDPASTNVYNDDSRHDILKPKISCLTDSDKVTFSPGKSLCELNYYLNVKSPEVHNSYKLKSDESQLILSIKQSIKQLLSSAIPNWQSFNLDQDVLGDLLIFDYLYISTDGMEWDFICCYFFENVILLVDGQKLVGKILIHSEIRGMERLQNGMILNLINSKVAELQLRHDNPIVISKWEALIHKVTKKLVVGFLNLYQMSSNAWGLLKDLIPLPLEVLEFCDLITSNSDIPTPLLIRAVIRPEPLPLNLVISVPLINQSSMSDQEYKINLSSMLRYIRATLRPFDKLGLIFVGTDGRRNPSRSGAFIGCVEASWDGWDRVIEDIKISSNFRRSHTLMHNDLQELTISIEKCMDLFPFIPNNPNNVNKFIILNCNNFNTSMPSSGVEKSKGLLSKMIHSLLDRLSITLVRIGDEYTEALKYVHDIIANPNYDSTSSPKFTYGSGLLRFDSFKEFNLELNYLITEKFQSICTPSIQLDFNKDFGTKSLVKFAEIEVNGQLIPLENVDTFSVVVKDIAPSTERSISIKVLVDLPQDQVENSFGQIYSIENLPIMSYRAKWLEESSDENIYTRLSASVNEVELANRPKSLPAILDNRGTKPVNKSIIRRQTELTVINALRKAAEQESPASSQEIIMSSISIALSTVQGSSPAADFSIQQSKSAFSKSNTLRLEAGTHRIVTDPNDYIQFLVSEMRSVGALFENNPILAKVVCEDLASSLQ